jgi:hypothetical protein
MNRKALLIGCPSISGKDDYLPGVTRDLANYDRFLRSPLGGHWYSNEIVSLSNPSSDAVRDEIDNLRTADYSFVLFSGHGFVHERSTIVCLGDDEEIDSIELCGGAPKHAVLLDCCRIVAKPMLAEDALAKMDSLAKSLTALACRRYYEKAISDCRSGLIVAHSCDMDETANDDARRGGYYSYSLIDAAEDWAENNSTDLEKYYTVLGIPAAHERASDTVRLRSGGRQHPQIEKPRSGPYFPFAVVAT